MLSNRRQRLLAAVATLLFGPGAGHLALGRIHRGLAWFATLIATLLVLAGAAVLCQPMLFWTAFGAAGVLYVAALVDVVRSVEIRPPRWTVIVALWIAVFVVGRGAAMLLRAHVVEAFQIPAGSMSPTLLVGDHIFVDKRTHPPRRGEVVVFKYPQDPDKDFVKRVVAVGGDTIELRDGVLVLNGQPLERHRVDGDCRYEDQDDTTGSWIERACEAWDETLDGHTYRVIFDREERPRTFRPFQVPQGSFYVLGDNRDNSHDSRYWGPVPLDHLRGQALFVWFSSGQKGVRWSRIDAPVK